MLVGFSTARVQEGNFEGKMVDEDSPGKFMAVSTLTQAECEEGEVDIQCIQSSEFVVGKQTNFNGPVTLINCVDAPDEGNPTIKSENLNDEKIIIRDKVLSQSGPAAEQNYAGEEKNSKGHRQSQEKFWSRALNTLKKIPVIPLLVCVGLVAAAIIALTAFLIISSGEEDEGGIIGSHYIYTKKAWRGKPPRSTVLMKLPIPYVVISHTASTQCFNLKACAVLIQNMQQFHLNLNFADISYNFLVDSKGNIYEGRGWNVRNTMGEFVNGRNIDIGLIGEFSENAYPTDSQMDGLKDLLEFGVESQKISNTYSLLAASSVHSTLSPGKNVYAIIKLWPHFDPDPKSHVKEYV